VFRRFSAFIFLLFCFFRSFTQDVEVRGSFGFDSLKIGQAVPYSLTARYPREINLIFPDSTYAFAPFEFEAKRYFTTRTKEGISFDSVVYVLSTFEVDSVQRLSLPVFVIHKQDCTAYSAAADSVFVVQLVKHIPDSVSAEKLPLKTNTAYQRVSWLFNYPLVLIAAGSLVILSLMVWIFFGKRIRKHFKVKRMNRMHREFLQKYSDQLAQLKVNASHVKAESVLVLWKTYMENLLSKPYPKLTSKEILISEGDEKLGKALRTIDRAIYGREQTFQEDSFILLKDYSEYQFRKKLEEVQYG